jgi:hypothetical protein
MYTLEAHSFSGHQDNQNTGERYRACTRGGVGLPALAPLSTRLSLVQNGLYYPNTPINTPTRAAPLLLPLAHWHVNNRTLLSFNLFGRFVFGDSATGAIQLRPAETLATNVPMKASNLGGPLVFVSIWRLKRQDEPTSRLPGSARLRTSILMYYIT